MSAYLAVLWLISSLFNVVFIVLCSSGAAMPVFLSVVWVVSCVYWVAYLGQCYLRCP